MKLVSFCVPNEFCYTLTRDTGNHLGGGCRSSGDFLDALKSDMTVEEKGAPPICFQLCNKYDSVWFTNADRWLLRNEFFYCVSTIQVTKEANRLPMHKIPYQIYM